MGLSRLWGTRRALGWVAFLVGVIVLGLWVVGMSDQGVGTACIAGREVIVQTMSAPSRDEYHDLCGRLTKNLPMTSNQIQVAKEVETYMEERRQQVRDACKAVKDPGVGNNSIIEDRFGIFFCPVPKVASTFWTRVFYQLHYSEPVGSPFDVPVPKAMPSDFYKFKLKLPAQVIRQRDKAGVFHAIHHLTRFTYVRDPFSRIFSAFVDKMLAPNPFHWNSWGNAVFQRYGKNQPGKASRKSFCHHDTSFHDFTQLVIDELWNKDVHTEPVSQRCSPCLYDFQVIGKMETFYKDALNILTRINMSETQIQFDRMEEDRTADAIEDSIKDSLSKKWLSMSLQCLSKDAILRRILRKLQIRGFISWRYKYPFTPEQAEIVDFEFYKRVLKDAERAHYNKKEQSLQKKQAFKEAFQTITEGQFKKLRELYWQDLAMFGYPSALDPSVVLEKLTKVNTGAFDWTKDWDLSPLL